MAYTVPRPTVLVVNYPSNPTARSICLYNGWSPGRENKVWTSPISPFRTYYDGKPTRSILEVPGAKDVAVEFTSMSKTYSMAGWRMGFAVGNPELIGALTRVKSYLDYGAFTPIQAAACAALNGPQDIVEENRRRYQHRRDVMVEAFGRAGWDIPVPPASMFAWAPLPPGFHNVGSLEFSKQLLEHAGVAVAAGVGYGEEGEVRPDRHGGERTAHPAGGPQRERFLAERANRAEAELSAPAALRLANPPGPHVRAAGKVDVASFRWFSLAPEPPPVGSAPLGWRLPRGSQSACSTDGKRRRPCRRATSRSGSRCGNGRSAPICSRGLAMRLRPTRGQGIVRTEN